MKNLQILNAKGNSGITDEEIKGLNLIELYASNNLKITNVSFMKNLQILDASYDSGITDEGIKGLSLVKLYSKYNLKITKLYKN